MTTIETTDDVSSRLLLLIAVACGLLVANLYYAQPLVGPIAQALGMAPSAQGLIVTAVQIGYCAGLVLVVPLADLVENRRLVICCALLAGVALLGAATAGTAAMFLAAALGIGLGSTAAQVLVPYASHLAPPAIRGRVVGNVMSGLMLGIMLARPVSSLLAELASWHLVFWLSAVAMLGLAAVLGLLLPPRVPEARVGYGALIGSMGRLFLDLPLLRRRSLYQFAMFGAFSLFWTAVPLQLAGHFGLGQGGIALFSLAGAAGAVATPLAGRIADRGWLRPATWAALAMGAAAFLLARFGLLEGPAALGVLVVTGILLDFSVAANLTLGQRAIYALDPAIRGRLNAVYMSTFFVGGALGSMLGGWAHAVGGWSLACWIGLALPVVAMLYLATEPAQRR